MQKLFSARRRLISLVVAGFVLLCCVCVRAGTEQMFFGFDAANPLMTNDIRTAPFADVGYAWWSSEEPKINPETGLQMPYAYHDAWADTWLVNGTYTPQQMANRWWSIIQGNGDPFFPLRVIGNPTIIVIDEIGSDFSDANAPVGGNKGPKLRQALDAYFALSGNRSHIVAMISPGLSQQLVNPADYDDLMYCANSRLRWIGLELYCSYSGFLNGFAGLDGDAYLCRYITQPIYNWTTNVGIFTTRIRATLKVSNDADGSGRTDFHKFLNREFWLMANGWRDEAHTLVSANVKAVLRGGVGAYIFRPGAGADNLDPSITARDSHHKQFIKWYCTDGNLTAHTYGLATPPP